MFRDDWRTVSEGDRVAPKHELVFDDMKPALTHPSAWISGIRTRGLSSGLTPWTSQSGQPWSRSRRIEAVSLWRFEAESSPRVRAKCGGPGRRTHTQLSAHYASRRATSNSSRGRCALTTDRCTPGTRRMWTRRRLQLCAVHEGMGGWRGVPMYRARHIVCCPSG